MFKKIALLAVASVPMFAASANAVDVTGNLNVTADIAASCVLTVGPTISFGTGITSTLTALNAASNVQVNCSAGTPYSVGINRGQNGTFATRRMASGTNFLNYELFFDPARTGSTVFLDVPASTRGGTGSGVDQNHDIFAQISSQTTPPSGAYSDTVLVTVRY